MLKLNKIVSMVLAIGVIASMSTSAFASKEIKKGTITEHKMTNNKNITATYTPVNVPYSSMVSFDHSYGITIIRGGRYIEEVWGKTYHYIAEPGKPNQNVDGYTRARWEKGKTIRGDSGRRWDSADGGIHGYSEAISGFIANQFGKHGYAARTYYGS